MKNSLKLIFVILVLSLAMLACGLSSIPSIPSLPGSDAPVFKDNFDGLDKTWGTGTDADSSIEYGSGGLQFKLVTPNYFVWSGPNDTNYSSTHIEVTAKNNGNDPQAAFGVFCNKTVTDNFYYFAITADGQYAIVKTAVAKDDFFLTNNNQWAQSDLITPNAASYTIGADCGNQTLTLYVDGKEIASVQDSSYEKGGVGLFAWSAKEENGTNVTFDDFKVTKLK